MRIQRLHDWDLTPSDAIEVQRKLAPLVVREGQVESADMVAGCDIALGPRWRPGPGRAVVVALSFPELQISTSSIIEAPVRFPYIPGLLGFREIPLLAQAFEALDAKPDLVLVDGQGIAHPRRLGIASHLGLILDVPTIGCAKSRLTGSHEEVPNEAGSWVYLRDRSEVIGAVVRTRANVKPLYVSVGHKISLECSVQWVLDCVRGRRLPEPTRLADRLAGEREVSVEPLSN
jgi:deoxyribonuclease V